MDKNIKMIYSSIDGCYKTARYKTAAGARKFAQKWLGDGNGGWMAEIGGAGTYAISWDGVGKVEAIGINLNEIWGE